MSDLRTFRKCDTWQIWDLQTQSFFVICGLKTSASPQIYTFSPYKYKIRCSILKFVSKTRVKIRLLGLFWDRVVQNIGRNLRIYEDLHVKLNKTGARSARALSAGFNPLVFKKELCKRDLIPAWEQAFSQRESLACGGLQPMGEPPSGGQLN